MRACPAGPEITSYRAAIIASIVATSSRAAVGAAVPVGAAVWALVGTATKKTRTVVRRRPLMLKEFHHLRFSGIDSAYMAITRV